MGADMKNLRTRIRSVDSTLHLTKAMGLVASSKIRRANEAMAKSREYARAIGSMIETLTGSAETRKSPYMTVRDTGRTRLIVIAGDRGLCGGYNANIFRLMREYPDTDNYPIGKRSSDRYGGGYKSSETFSRDDSYELASLMCRDFREGKYDRLGIVCTEYVSVLSQTATVKWVLPLTASDKNDAAGILFEPSEEAVLDAAVPEYVSGLIMEAVRESFACEVAARRMAMDSAGKNAEEMIADLQLSYNRARQGAITQEITEIVAGANAE